MKKFLQKAFAMLVLCLMSMSAMAQEKVVTFDFTTTEGCSEIAIGSWGNILTNNNYDCKEGQEFKKEDVWLCGTGTCSGGGTYTRFYLNSASSFTVSSHNASWLIAKVDVVAKNNYFNLTAPSGGATGADGDDNWNPHSKWPASFSNYEFTWTEGVDPVESLTFNSTGMTYVGKIIVTLESAVPAEPMDYTVSVAGTADASAGVMYKSVAYHDGETLPGVVGMTASNVSPVAIAGYDAVVTLVGSVFTVTYTRPEYYSFDFTKANTFNESGIHVESTASSNSYSGINIYGSRTLTITSENAIEKIVFGGLTPYSGGGSSAVSCSQGDGSWENDNNSSSPATWIAAPGTLTAKFTNENGADFWIHDIKVYLAAPAEPTPAPSFPEEGVAYEIQNTNGGCYLNLQNSTTYAAYLSDQKEEIYFTWDEMKAGFTIRDAEGNYMGKSSANAWNMDSSAPEYWTVEEISAGNYAFKSASSNYLGFNGTTSGNNGFRDKNYSANNGIFTIVPFVAPAVGSFNMSDAGYATLCLDKAWTVPAGYNAYVAGKDVAGEAVLVEGGEIVLTEITDVPANVGVILEGAESDGAVNVYAPASAPVAPAVNFLIGNSSNDAQNWTASAVSIFAPGAYDSYGADAQLYQLAKENEKVGFYRQVEDGSTLSCGAHKAFLVVPNGVAASNARFVLPGQGATGINVIATESNDTIYNLQGQRVNAAKAGVYVKNGKKIIVK